MATKRDRGLVHDFACDRQYVGIDPHPRCLHIVRIGPIEDLRLSRFSTRVKSDPREAHPIRDCVLNVSQALLWFLRRKSQEVALQLLRDPPSERLSRHDLAKLGWYDGRLPEANAHSFGRAHANVVLRLEVVLIVDLNQ